MRIGIFGGSFDPVHLAHLILAETCLDVCQLDQVRFIPASIQPLKTEVEPASTKQRLAMVEFATAGIPEFVVDPREIKRGGISYTCETLAEIQQEFPEAELFFLMGSDSLHDLPAWKEPETIAKLARIVAVNRGPVVEANIQQALAALPESVRQAVQVVEMPAVAISATDLRGRISENRSIRFLTPRPVERYIQEQKLYRAG